MFSPKIRKYIVLNCNDSPATYYQSQGSFSGLAKCPENNDKSSEVLCSVFFSLESGAISAIRIVCAGPPALLAAGNLTAEQSRGKDLNYLVEFSRLVYISNALEMPIELADAQGVWALERAVDSALTSRNDSSNK